jgi:oligopeptide/dipeptide ABC transporter ATP-binding protein
MTQPLLEVKNLSTVFRSDQRIITAANDVSLTIDHGELVGLVGESGCGKSVTAMSIMGLVDSPGRIEQGNILYYPEETSQEEDFVDLLTLRNKDMRKLRGNKIAMIFQEPMTSLNPVFTIGNQIEESLKLHHQMSKSERKDKMVEMLQLVRIPDAAQTLKCYPHELSGGMRQRVMIAMALSGNPDLLIADEPTTALDVTIQAQVLDLLKELQEKMGMSLLLITHDLGVVAETVHKVIVMYAGRVVEQASCEDLFQDPQHPYTRALMQSIPSLDKQTRLTTIPGNVPRLDQLPQGCAFQERCAQVKKNCCGAVPDLTEIKPNHWVRCYYPGDV